MCVRAVCIFRPLALVSRLAPSCCPPSVSQRIFFTFYACTHRTSLHSSHSVVFPVALFLLVSREDSHSSTTAVAARYSSTFVHKVVYSEETSEHVSIVTATLETILERPFRWMAGAIHCPCLWFTVNGKICVKIRKHGILCIKHNHSKYQRNNFE